MSADFYPLAVGDRRSWRGTQGSDVGLVRSERVGALTTVGGREVFPVRSDDGSTEYLQLTTSALISVPGPGADALSVAAGPVELLRFGMAAGQTVVTFDRTLSVDVDGDGRNDGVDLRVQSSFVGLENIDTAAGSFTGAAHLRAVVRSTVRPASGGAARTIEVTTDEWYVLGVGPVRTLYRTVTNGGPAQSDAEDVFAYGVGSRRSESVAPALVSATPAADAPTGTDVRVTLNFSEPLDPLSLDGSSGLNLFNATGQTVPTTRTLAQGGQQITLVPQSALVDGRYEVRTGTGVTDLANNPLPALLRGFSVDTQGPRLVSSSPANGAAAAPLTGTITLSFDEPVFAAPGSSPQFELFELDGFTRSVLPGVIQGRDVLVTPTAPLLRNRPYQLVPITGLFDARGNALNAGNSRISFRTDPGPLARPVMLEEGALVYAVSQGDVNGDGRSDLVYAAQRDSNDFYIGARLQQADGRYASAVRLAPLVAAGICRPRRLSLADVDADGRLDIALTGCNGSLSGAQVLRQTSPGNFVADSTPQGLASFRIASLDVSGDGRAELATLSAVGSEWHVNFLRRDATAGWVSALTLAIGTGVVADFAFADFNGDGQADLLWLRGLPDNINWELAWAPRQGAGFGPVRTLALPIGLSSFPSLSAGDVNGDGRPDVVLLLRSIPPGRGSEVSRLQALRNDGGGGFVASATLELSPGAGTVNVGDVDGDGRVDVLVARSNQLGVVLQGADGSLQAERLFESGFGDFDNVDALALLDLNGDGRRDVVVTASVLLGRPTAGAWPLGGAVGASAVDSTQERLRALSAQPRSILSSTSALQAANGSAPARVWRALLR